MNARDTGKLVLASVRSLISSLPPGDKKVAQAILDDPESIIHMTVAELATRAGTAESTTVRCCRKLGYKGFQDLKIHLARELSQSVDNDHKSISKLSSPQSILSTVLSFNTEVIADINSSLQPESFDQALTALLNARQVSILGFGFSYFVCLDAQDRLASIGVDARAPESPNMKLMHAARLQPQDVAILVSHTGATKDLIRYCKLAQDRGATTIALTSYSRSRLAKLADITLVAGGRDLDFRFDAASARLAHLTVLDALYLALALKLGKKAEESLAIFHDEEAAWRL